MNTTPKIHNPDNLTPEQYGAAEGWRLMYVGEQTSTKDQFWSWSEWKQDHNPGPIQSYHATCRTRTPDPYASKAAAKGSAGWIKMSERKPKEADLPVCVWHARDQKAKYIKAAIGRQGVQDCALAAFSHWMPAPFDPPLQEKSRHAKDLDAFAAWEDGEGSDCMTLSGAFLAGIAYERAEIAKMMTIGPGSWLSPLWKKIEARVKGTQ